MAKVAPLQSDFSGGEFSPLLEGRVDADRYKQGLSTCLNWIPTVQGGVVRRPGTKFVAEVKTSSKATRLMPFEFSATQTYIIEFGDLYIRFYKDNAQIESSPGVPYEIVSPYPEAALFQIKHTQSADVLYLVHPSYAPRKLSRYGDANWVLETISFLDGPYFSANYTGRRIDTSTTITPSAFTGTGITLLSGPTVNVSTCANNGSGLIRVTTAAAHNLETGDGVFIAGITGTTEANGNWPITRISATQIDLQGSAFANAYIGGPGTVRAGIFRSTDVGRVVRMLQGSTWGYVRITAFTNYSSVTADVINTLTSTAAKTVWRLGLFSDTTGYPSCTVFHENRLWFAGVTQAPQYVCGSSTGAFEDFSPTDTGGVVASSNGVVYALVSNDVNAIKWLASDEKGLTGGSLSGEWIIRPSSQNEALTPTNVNAKKSTSFGSADIQPVQAGKASVFVQKSGRKVHDLSYYYDVDGFRSPNLTEIAEHITGGGIVQLAYQRSPQPIVWAVRDDGILLGMTYQREFDNLKVAWHRHILGGYSDAANTHAKVESVATISSTDGTYEELWVVVKRWINGAQVRFIEYLTPLFDATLDQQDAYFVDCGGAYDVPKTLASATKANPGVFTVIAHGWNNGDKVIFSNMVGMNEMEDVSGFISNKTADTFRLTDVETGLEIDTSAFSTYVSSGQVRKMVTTISGLTWLEGETVSILSDGAVESDQEVSSGAITLDTPGAVVQVGLAYNSDLKTLRLEAGASNGTALGKTRRIHRLGILMHRTLGLNVGRDFDNLDEISFRTSDDELTRAVPLFTGIKSLEFNADYDFENQICIRISQPLPATILALMPQMETQDR